MDFLKRNRSVLWGLLSLVVLIVLERWTGLSKLVLFAPVLVAMIALMTLSDRALRWRRMR